MSSTQEITKCLSAIEIKEYINHTLNDPYNVHYAEDYIKWFVHYVTYSHVEMSSTCILDMILCMKRLGMRDSFIDDFSEECERGKSFFLKCTALYNYRTIVEYR